MEGRYRVGVRHGVKKKVKRGQEWWGIAEAAEGRSARWGLKSYNMSVCSNGCESEANVLYTFKSKMANWWPESWIFAQMCFLWPVFKTFNILRLTNASSTYC